MEITNMNSSLDQVVYASELGITSSFLCATLLEVSVKEIREKYL